MLETFPRKEQTLNPGIQRSAEKVANFSILVFSLAICFLLSLSMASLTENFFAKMHFYGKIPLIFWNSKLSLPRILLWYRVIYAFFYTFYKVSYNSLSIFSHRFYNVNSQCIDSYQWHQNIQMKYIKKYLEVKIHNAVAVNTANIWRVFLRTTQQNKQLCSNIITASKFIVQTDGKCSWEYRYDCAGQY